MILSVFFRISPLYKAHLYDVSGKKSTLYQYPLEYAKHMRKRHLEQK